MKKAIIFMGLLTALILNVSWMMEGCTGKIPPIAAIVATSTATLRPNVVVNFEDQSVNLNKNLINSSNGNLSYLPGTINIIGSPGALGTNFAGGVSVAPTALSGYSPYELQANPVPGGVYSLLGTAYASTTNGIQFYWKTGTTDNMPARWFIAPVPPQLPPPLGNCPGTGGGCYDTFKVVMSSTGGSWNLVQVPWGSMNQAGWGFPQVGNLATGSYGGKANISQILYFQWEEDPNNNPGTYGCNFWVDEVQLY